MRNNEDAAADGCDVAIHAPLLVLEDAQVHDFFRELFRNGLRVLRANAEQHEIALPDLAVYLALDRDGCALDARDDRAHYLPAFMRLTALNSAWMDAVMMSVSMPAPHVTLPSLPVMPI